MSPICFRRFISGIASARLRDPHLPRSRRDFSTTLTTTAFDRSSSGWFAAPACTATAEGHQTTRSGSSISRTAPHPAAWSSTSSLLQRSCSHPSARSYSAVGRAGTIALGLGSADAIGKAIARRIPPASSCMTTAQPGRTSSPPRPAGQLLAWRCASALGGASQGRPARMQSCGQRRAATIGVIQMSPLRSSRKSYRQDERNHPVRGA